MALRRYHKDELGVPHAQKRGSGCPLYPRQRRGMPLPSLTRPSKQALVPTATHALSELRFFRFFQQHANCGKRAYSSLREDVAKVGGRFFFIGTFSLLFLLPFFPSAQTDTTFRNAILRKFNTMRLAEDAEKLVASAMLETELAAFYADPGHFNVQFDSVPFLGQLTSSDGVVKMLCWNLALTDGSYRYHCIMRHQPNKETVAVTVFQDNADWTHIDRKPVRPNKWYGALYYRILADKYRKKTYYTILGWDGKDQITNRKVVDVITIQGSSVILGSSIFTNGNDQPVHRLIYEYANDVSMALNYDEREKMIIMDHLAPEDSRFTGQYQFYGPDFSYDGLEFKKGEWHFKRDVFAKNRGLNNLPENARPSDFRD